jgi:hypothetical protein
MIIIPSIVFISIILDWSIMDRLDWIHLIAQHSIKYCIKMYHRQLRNQVKGNLYWNYKANIRILNQQFREIVDLPCFMCKRTTLAASICMVIQRQGNCLVHDIYILRIIILMVGNETKQGFLYTFFIYFFLRWGIVKQVIYLELFVSFFSTKGQITDQKLFVT